MLNPRQGPCPSQGWDSEVGGLSSCPLPLYPSKHRGLQKHTGPAVSTQADLCPLDLVECSAVTILKFLIILEHGLHILICKLCSWSCMSPSEPGFPGHLAPRQLCLKPPGSPSVGQESTAFRGFKGWSCCPCSPQASQSSYNLLL